MYEQTGKKRKWKSKLANRWRFGDAEAEHHKTFCLGEDCDTNKLIPAIGSETDMHSTQLTYLEEYCDSGEVQIIPPLISFTQVGLVLMGGVVHWMFGVFVR